MHALLVDVGGTLLDERRFDVAAGFRAALLALGADAEPAASLACELRQEAACAHLHHEELPIARWLARRAQRKRVMSHDDLEDLLWTSIVTLVQVDGAAEALARIAGAGVPIAAVSNAPFSARVLLGELERHGLATHLKLVVSSADVGRCKPHAEIFRLAVERLGAAPGSTWFVGDTVEEDIVGATAAGLKPIWFNPHARPSPAGAPERHHEMQSWREIAARITAIARASRR